MLLQRDMCYVWGKISFAKTGHQARLVGVTINKASSKQICLCCIATSRQDEFKKQKRRQLDYYTGKNRLASLNGDFVSVRCRRYLEKNGI